MNELNLNINDYNYDDLIRIFKINNIENIESREILSDKLDNKMQQVKQKYSPDIYSFFYKGKLVIISIYDLIQNKYIKNNQDTDMWFNRIKGLSNLENYNEVELFYELTDGQGGINKFYDKKIIKDDQIIPNIKSEINTPYYELAGRVNPSLNNKNNTNIIVNTDVNTISPGELNSVKRITQFLNVNLNSCFRNNYYQSNPCDFTYQLPTEIYKVVSMRLVSIEIPNSWYLFSDKKKNNKFQIIIHKQHDKQQDLINECYNIDIPEGNYNCDTLQEYLNSTYFFESDVDTLLKHLKFSINPYSLKSSFEVINEEECDYKITFSLKFTDDITQNIMNTFGWIIGFRLGNYLNIDTCITSESLFDAGGDRYVYLCINDFQYNNNTSNLVYFDKSSLNEEVIAKIPMINGKLSLIVNDNNNNLSKIRRYNGPVNISRLQIKILDRFGCVIDLNNMDFSMTLELEILYENFNFKNVTS
jgi:hypothetical protein